MKKSLVCRFSLFVPVIFFILTNFSCSSTKKVKYFQDIPDSGKLKSIANANYIEPKIQTDDILTIIIQVLDPSATQMMNAGNTSVAGISITSSSAALSLAAGGASQASGIPYGYLVDKDGNVNVPVLGKIKALGYTTSELRDIIADSASKFYKNPSVIVRFSNFKISVMGEVNKPGQFVVPNEKISVLDAIAMAGDMTIFGKRDNVLLIRENLDGTKTPHRFNLKKSDIISSPYYYLRQNDVIYVEPNSAKAAATDAVQARNYSIAAALLSILVIYLTRTK